MRPARAAGRGEGGGAGDRGVDGDPARRGRTRALLRAARRTGRAPRPAAALDGNECRLRDGGDARRNPCPRSEEHTSELQSLMRISYDVFCMKKKNLHTYSLTLPHQITYIIPT